VAHPQALAQCHEWLSTHLPQAERRPVSSNAEGARLASLDPSLAGIASERAGSEFGLHVVARRSRTTPTTARASPSSPTRAHPAPKARGHDCTSLVVSVANRPGAVHDLLVPLKNTACR
jgi:chorismate mutase/prephenate dehydratase